MTRGGGNLTFLDTTLFGGAPGGGRDGSLLEDPVERSERTFDSLSPPKFWLAPPVT